MLDFSSASFNKMDYVGVEDAAVSLDGLLLDGETIRYAYKGAQLDGVHCSPTAVSSSSPCRG